MKVMPAVRQAQNRGFKIKVVNVAIDREAGRKQNIRVVPTFLRWENGHVVNRRSGRMSESRLEEFCRGL